MSHVWSLITSTVLDSEGEIPGDDDDGQDDFEDDIGDATMVGDGNCLEAVVGDADSLCTSEKKGGRAQEGGGVNTEVAMASGKQEAFGSRWCCVRLFEPPQFLWR